MIKDKLIPLGITFTIIAGAVGCDIANDKPVEETPVVEVEEPIKTKPRVVRPTKIQSLYLSFYRHIYENGCKITTFSANIEIIS